jgi:hypothetical protein
MLYLGLVCRQLVMRATMGGTSAEIGSLEWEWSRLQCRNCGDLVDPQRVELGYDYCLKEECQQRCMKRVLLAAVGVNKAADYYMKAEEVVPPPVPQPPPVPRTTTSIDDDETPRVRGRRLPSASQKRVKTTLDRLRDEEVELDAALQRSYERFCRGEVTAREMDRERDELIRAFNQRVMSENIRYRSMLRRL